MEYNAKIKDPKFKDWRLFVGLLMDHTYPITVMIIDWMLLSTVPFALRHAFAFIPISMAYFSVNVGWQVVTGMPVYNILDWTKLKTYPLFFGAVAAQILFTFIMWKLTKIKL